jgi:hypothetical protein
MVEWYEFNEEERIKQVYTKYTIKDFLDWWQNSTSNIMEVRITDVNLLKEVAKKYDLPYSSSGVYVYTVEQLKAVIKECRDKSVMWFSCNSRKKAYNKWGNKSFGSGNKGGSSSENVNNIEFLAIDIDRLNKIAPATNEELHKCDILANKVIERMAINNWSERYIKLCSGNGVQLLFALDIPIKMPNIEYDLKTKIFKTNNEFETMKDLIREGIGKDILYFANKFKDELNVELDKSCFKAAGVLTLPFTKNYKYDGYTWRGIIEIKNGVNEGLTDYILSKYKDIKLYKSKNIFKQSRGSKTDNIIKAEKLENYPLVRLMLDIQLPYGRINNVPWLMLKCLIRDNKLTFQNEYVSKVHKLLEQKYKGNFSTNLPEAKYEFKEEIINRYCADCLIPPIFPLNKIRMVKEAFDLNLDWDMLFLGTNKVELKGNDMFEDMKTLKDVLFNSSGNYNNIVYDYTNSMIEKYGEEKVKYFFNNWFEYYLGYRGC